MMQQKGTLLLEVLIAATVLAVGILSCLNIFSAAIHASSRVYETQVAHSYMEQALFNLFLDPTLVDLEEGKRSLSTDRKNALSAQLNVKKLDATHLQDDREKSESKSADTQNAQSQKVVVQSGAVAAEFYDVDFVAERAKGKVKYEFQEVLFRYGQRKKKE